MHLVQGGLEDCNRLVAEASERMGWFDMSMLKKPYWIEGNKTMGLELANQLGWTLPDVIFYPTGGGTGFIGIWKPLRSWRRWAGSARSGRAWLPCGL